VYTGACRHAIHFRGEQTADRPRDAVAAASLPHLTNVQPTPAAPFALAAGHFQASRAPQSAERSGMKKAGIANLEQSRREPSWATVVALSMALAVTPNDFLQEPGERPDTGPGRPRKAALDAKATETPAAAPAKRKGLKRGRKGQGKGKSPA
jgi:transcriptional regulator with XRE-family HTH domain